MVDTVIRLLRTAEYWTRRALRPSSLRWTADDDYEYEWLLWLEDA